jgi:hypothetical protein
MRLTAAARIAACVLPPSDPAVLAMACFSYEGIIKTNVQLFFKS